MAYLYVTNCTGQDVEVNYRLDFTVDDQGRRTSERLVPYKKITIPARRQIRFAGDMHALQISEIVSQIEKTCRAVHASEIKTAKARGVVKLLWQQDKEIPVPILKDVVAHNVGLLSDQGAKRRQQMALVANHQLTNLIEHEPAKMELEFEQEGEDEDRPGRLEEGLRIRRSDKPAPKPRAPRRAAAG